MSEPEQSSNTLQTQIEKTKQELFDFAQKYLVHRGRAIPRIWFAVNNYLITHPQISFIDKETVHEELKTKGFIENPDLIDISDYLEKRLNIRVNYSKLQQCFKEIGLYKNQSK